MTLVKDRSPSHILGFPLLCSFTKASKRSRHELYRHDGISFFVNLLNTDISTKWQIRVLGALEACVTSDGAGVEKILCEQQNLSVLIEVFKNSPLGSQPFLEPYMKILADGSLKRLNQALGESNLVQSVKERLQGRERNQYARRTLMEILKSLFEGHQNAKVMISQFSLYGLVEGLSKNDNALIVKQLATDLLRAFNVQRLL